MAKAPIRIVIVDDHALLAESLGAWIVRQPDLVLVGRAEDGEAGWNLCLELKPDLALVDVDLPKLDGLELVKRLLVKMPTMRLITMTGRMDPYTIWRASQSGVHGYMEKTLPPEMLVEAVRTVAKGGTFFSCFSKSETGVAVATRGISKNIKRARAGSATAGGGRLG